ncbi:hypothetical protein EZ449_17285 [Pedobacter frigidisoli]|uniref:Uncharacterized protein n=1 Tax=Pedobacter frigidisoli TaxID=2530455 RepID=A0A4R0NT52_9SPHI|nr:hypothetical protein [Pedobacter frigidisoli]TCD04391.1 hypothetical protein EZ449_17285 [Pedobacter frigidisoli]
MTKQLYILVFALALFSCNQRKESEADIDLLYFDLKGFFGKEISRLQKLNPSVNKMVSINESVENKITKIHNWEKELAIFVNADINRKSWRGSFRVREQNGVDIYTSDNKKIPVKMVSITWNGQRAGKIEIVIDNKNILFQSHDTLTYCPDSLYQIKKRQKIRLLEEKNYLINGKF